MEFSWEEIVEMFNNNDFEVEKYFNDYQTFFNVLNKRGLMGEIDPRNATDGEVWQNEYLLWAFKNNKEHYYKFISEFLSDVEFENGRAYLEISDRSDLAKLFCDGRRYDLSRNTIESILSGEDFYEGYYDTTNNVYEDVIEELTPENDRRLQEYIVDTLKGQQIPAETDELELIASEQGHPEYVEVDMENVKRIIDDGITMIELLNDQLIDLRGELYNIHSNAYNSAMESALYDEIWNELETYFEGHGEWISRAHPYKKDTQIQYFKVPIRNFEQDINDYLYNNKGYGNSGTLEYHGSYLDIMAHDRDCLSAQAPEYPNSRQVDKNINEYFGEYI